MKPHTTLLFSKKKNLFLAAGLFLCTAAVHAQKYTPVQSDIYVELNKIIYSNNDTLSAVLYPANKTEKLLHPFLVLASAKTKDVEVIKLVGRNINNEDIFIAQKKLVVSVGTGIASPKKGDGVLSIAPGEMFYCIYYPKDSLAIGKTKNADMIFDFGLGENNAVKTSIPVLLPELALTMDEKESPGQEKKTGTVTVDKGLPVQLAATQLILYPRNKNQLNRFLRFTHGRIAGRDTREESFLEKKPSAYLIEVDLAKVNTAHFAQLRSTWGLIDKVYYSNPQVLKLMTLVFQCLADGYAVTVNPRLQLMDDTPLSYVTAGHRIPVTPAFPNENVSPSISDAVFSVRKLWSFMALWDKDEKEVPVGIIDQGFFPTTDFRGFPNSIHQCDLTTSFLNIGGFSTGDCGPHKAEGEPTVANGLLTDSWSWHGTGVTTIAGGMINNGPLVSGNSGAGTGGQVVRPMLYKVNLSTYAFHIGQAIKAATDDGATVINLSMGYPCKIVTKLFGGWAPGICTESDRASFCTAITASLFGAATVICAHAPIIDALTFGLGGGIAACIVANLAATTASAACYATLIEGDVKGLMQRGVDYALERGVTVVACAGNNMSESNSSKLEVLKKIIDLDPANQRVELWQIIPASLPGVICVGAASNDRGQAFNNLHFFGNRVDIWGPITSNYVAPRIDNGAINIANPLVFAVPLGGTSASTPYITGLVADMQALNPSLNPKTPGLSSDQLKSIPGQILNLLRTTAYTEVEMNTMGFADPTGRRRNLVNPMRLIQTTALGVVPDFAARNYSTELNFDARESAGNDNAASAKQIIDTATGTIVNFPATGPGASPINDADYFYWQTPVEKGIYSNGFIELKTPVSSGELLLNDDKRGLISSNISGDELVKRYSIPSLISGDEICFDGFTQARYIFQVTGKKVGAIPDDNIYKLAVTPPVLTASLPSPDRFDMPGGNLNSSFGNNNNARKAATLLGATGAEWTLNTPVNALEIMVPGLNFHNCADEDWFQVSIGNEGKLEGLTGPRRCGNISLTIEFGAGMDITVEQNGVLKTISNVSSFTFWNYSEPFFFQLKPTIPGEPISYDLKLSLRKAIDWDCFMKGIPRFPPADTWTELIRQCFKCGMIDGTRIVDINPLAATSISKRFGPANSAVFFINWSGKSNFRLITKAITGKIKSVSLATRDGKMVGELKSFPDNHFMINKETLEPGVYLLIVESGNAVGDNINGGRSHADIIQFPTMKIIVPRQANYTQSISSEIYSKEFPFLK